MFGGRKGHEGAVASGGAHHGGGRGDGFAVNAGARIGLAISQLLTAIVSPPGASALCLHLSPCSANPSARTC
jgi:hypothetical protein